MNLRDYDWRGQIETYRGLYKERCEAMLAALDEYMPAGLSWTRPEGGFFVWVTLPEGVDTYPLLKKAIDASMVFIPGAAFTRPTTPPTRSGWRSAPSRRSPFAKVSAGWHRSCGRPSPRCSLNHWCMASRSLTSRSNS